MNASHKGGREQQGCRRREAPEEEKETLLGQNLAPFLRQVTRDRSAPPPQELSAGSRTHHKDFSFDLSKESVSMTQRKFRLPSNEYITEPELDQRHNKILNSQQEIESRQFLTDEDILRLFPKQSGSSKQNVTRLLKCRWRECTAVAPAGCQGYCVKHFCSLYRENVLDIEPKSDKDKELIRDYIAGPNGNPRGEIHWQWSTTVTTPGYGYTNTPIRMRNEPFPVLLPDSDDEYPPRSAVDKRPVRKQRSKQRSKSRPNPDMMEGSLHPPETYTQSNLDKSVKTASKSDSSRHRKPREIDRYESPKTHTHRDSKHRKQDKGKRNDVIESGYSSSDTENKPLRAKPNTTHTKPKRCPGPMCFAMTTTGLCPTCENLLDHHYDRKRRSQNTTRISKKPCFAPDCQNYGSSTMNGLCTDCYTILNKARSKQVALPKCEYY